MGAPQDSVVQVPLLAAVESRPLNFPIAPPTPVVFTGNTPARTVPPPPRAAVSVVPPPQQAKNSSACPDQSDKSRLGRVSTRVRVAESILETFQRENIKKLVRVVPATWIEPSAWTDK